MCRLNKIMYIEEPPSLLAFIYPEAALRMYHISAESASQASLYFLLQGSASAGSRDGGSTAFLPQSCHSGSSQMAWESSIRDGAKEQPQAVAK